MRRAASSNDTGNGNAAELAASPELARCKDCGGDEDPGEGGGEVGEDLERGLPESVHGVRSHSEVPRSSVPTPESAGEKTADGSDSERRGSNESSSPPSACAFEKPCRGGGGARLNVFRGWSSKLGLAPAVADDAAAAKASAAAAKASAAFASSSCPPPTSLPSDAEATAMPLCVRKCIATS